MLKIISVLLLLITPSFADDTIETRRELAKTANILSEIEDQKATAEDKIAELQKQKIALTKKVKDTNANLSDAAAALVAIGATGTSFDEEKVQDYALSMSILGIISEGFNDDIETAVRQIKQLDKVQTALEKQIGIYQKVSKQHKKELADLQKLLDARARETAPLKSKQYELKNQVYKQAGSTNIIEIANKITPEAQNAKWSSGRKMRFPASGMILLRFGQSNASGLRNDGWRVRTRSAALVVAPADGKIEFADYFKGYNQIIIINHNNGYYSVLTGMGNLNVLIGQDVLAGEPIGRMPESSPEIYMELRKGSKPIDPARMFIEPR